VDETEAEIIGVLSKAIFHIDRKIGDWLEATIDVHHLRRLAKLGWDRALDPPEGIWAEGPPAPRDGNSIEVFVDGEEAFPAMVDAIRNATSHVHYAGWYMTPEFDLLRGETRLELRELLKETADRIPVRVLMWAGAPIPWRYPTSRIDVRDQAKKLCRGSRIHYAADPKERPLHCHHEKIIVVDDEIAFVGGIEPTAYQGDRFDSPHHRMRGERGWHDAGTRLRGPVVADVADHFRLRWQEVTPERLPAPRRPEPVGKLRAQIARTVPEKIYDSLPDGDFSILEAYMRGLRSARNLIYLENQFLWSHHIVKLLADKLRRPPSDDFRMIVLLPSRPTTGMDDTMGQLAVLVEADVDERLLACTLWSHSGSRMEQIYVHAKVAIVDDEWITIGSANLNNHSLFNDSEVNVVAHDQELAHSTRLRLWAEHLELSVADVADHPTKVFEDKWKPIAKRQLELRESGRPITHRLVELPGVSKRSKRLLGPVQSLFVDG
jgi:phosphatidylserine/phosphatidylglycerophosphate/cardiolipin synthase-like enzyme